LGHRSQVKIIFNLICQDYGFEPTQNYKKKRRERERTFIILEKEFERNQRRAFDFHPLEKREEKMNNEEDQQNM